MKKLLLLLLVGVALLLTYDRVDDLGWRGLLGLDSTELAEPVTGDEDPVADADPAPDLNDGVLVDGQVDGQVDEPVEELDLVVRGVEVRDLDGRVAWSGDVDLSPHLARIERGERDPHRNDGSVFHNRERLLPERPSGHYREYVIRTPGINHAGPQRLVIGSDGEIFYTHDHYRSFQRVR